MSPAMEVQPVLTDAEWQLIIELLEREQTELPGEIHHAFRRAVREELRRRGRVVDGLLSKLRTRWPSPNHPQGANR